MAGKPNTKLMDTMIAKHGNREAVRDWFAVIGSKGGKNGSDNKGFASKGIGDDGLTGKQRAAVAGAAGGRISKRKKVVK